MISISSTRAARIFGVDLNNLTPALLRTAYVIKLRESHPDSSGGIVGKHTITQLREARQALERYMEQQA